MRQTTLLVFIIAILVLSIFAGIREAPAAKLTVVWTAPTKNTDGSPLTDLTGFYIQWGSCTSTMTIASTQGGINASAGATSSPIYPTNLPLVCAQIFAVNSAGRMSAPVYMSYALTPPTLSQPTH